MNSAAAGNPVSARTTRVMEEVSAPVMFTFTQPKESLAGILLSIDVVTVKQKNVTQYLILREDGSRVQLLATYDLGRKIQRVHIGRFIEITYIGENRDVKKGDNYLREFRVQVEKGSPKFSDGTPITDEDVPF